MRRAYPNQPMPVRSPPPAPQASPSANSLNDLAARLRSHSPRHTRVATPPASAVIHALVLLAWLLLLWAAFTQQGVLAWSVGLAYAGYDTALLLFVAWQVRHPERTPAIGNLTPAQARSPTTLGVIVAAHNEAPVLAASLQALLSGDDRPDRIVVADDGSTDATDSVLQRAFGLHAPAVGTLSRVSPNHPELHWLRLPHGGKARALNAALQCIDTDTVLTVDADTWLEPGSLQAMRQAFEREPQLVAATGVITPVCGGGAAARLMERFQQHEYVRNFLSRRAWMQLDSLLLVSGAFAAFRREAVLRVGGFDPDCLVEDYELIHRLRRHADLQQLGWTVRVVPQARARTDAPAGLRAFLRQRRRWFGGFLQTQYWYRDMVGNRLHGKLGTRLLPVKAADTLQPLYGLTAVSLLLGFAFTRQWSLLAPALAVIGLKTGIDLLYHLWSARRYRQWVGDPSRAPLLQTALVALAEPFTFQLLRHTAAAWGWWSVLTGRASWGTQARPALGRVSAPDSRHMP